MKLKKLAAASFALTALFVTIPVAMGRASPASAALAFAIAAASVAAVLRDAARRGLTDKKLEKAVNPGVAILSGFLAEVLDVWLRDPLDIFLILLNAVAVASVVGSTLMLYRIGLSEAEAPEAEERELTPEERYALRERMQRRINRWRAAAFGRIYLAPSARRREDSGDRA
jgi:hypothetical protein